MLIAFEGLNGVGKTTYIEKLSSMISDRKIETITSKPSLEDMTKNGVYDIFHNPSLEDKDARFKLAKLFYKNQKSQDIGDSETIYMADRWFSSTVVYSVYPEVLENPSLLQDVKTYYEMITTGENFDVNFLMGVSAELKVLFKKFLNKMMLCTSYKPVYPDHIVYLFNSKAKENREHRENKTISRYELEDIDDVLHVLYVSYHNYINSEFKINVINVDINSDAEVDEEVNIQNTTQHIYQLLFGESQEQLVNSMEEKVEDLVLSNEQSEVNSDEEPSHDLSEDQGSEALNVGEENNEDDMSSNSEENLKGQLEVNSSVSVKGHHGKRK